MISTVTVKSLKENYNKRYTENGQKPNIMLILQLVMTNSSADKSSTDLPTRCTKPQKNARNDSSHSLLVRIRYGSQSIILINYALNK